MPDFARVIGTMWECPEWCRHDDVGGLPLDGRVRARDGADGLRIVHYGAIQPSVSVCNVGISVHDTVQADGTAVRDRLIKIHVGDDIVLSPYEVGELIGALQQAEAVAEADLAHQVQLRTFPQ